MPFSAIAIATHPAGAWAYGIAITFVPAAVTLTALCAALFKWKEPITAKVIVYAIVWSGIILTASLAVVIGDDYGVLPHFVAEEWVTWMIIALGWIGFSSLAQRAGKA